MERMYANSIHIIGLGGAGTNIVETFLSDERTINLLKREGIRLSLMALDVADQDIKSLQHTYEQVLKRIKAEGIPLDRLRLIAASVKSPTPDAMFDFVYDKFQDYLLREGVKLKEYRPWLSSAIEIPPLTGGVGRRRALSKAIYALNYYQLGIIQNYINAFKDQLAASIFTPIVLIVFGLGGGTGSGMVLDFVRQLRKVLGTGVAIIGLCILPCQADDPPAKGHAAYTSLMELALMLNRDLNNKVVEAYGEVYENAFNAMMFIPLAPVYGRTGNLAEAKRVIDKALVDMIYLMMDFDIADLLNGIGAEVGLTDNFINAISMMRIIYPVDDYIHALKAYIEKLTGLGRVIEEKLKVMDLVSRLLDLRKKDLTELYKKYLIETGAYVEERFDESLKELLRTSTNLDQNYLMQLKSLEDSIKAWIEDLNKGLSTIGMYAKEGGVEDAVAKNIQEGLNLLQNVAKSYEEFSQVAEAIIGRLQDLVPSARGITAGQRNLISGFVNLLRLTDTGLKCIYSYLEARALADILFKLYSKLPKTEENEKILSSLRKIGSIELQVIFNVISTLFNKPTSEVKFLDSLLTEVRILRNTLNDARNALQGELDMMLERIKLAEAEVRDAQKEFKKSLMPFSKKKIKQRLDELEKNLASLNAKKAIIDAELNKVEELISLYSDIEKKLDAVSDYRKNLYYTVELEKEYYDRMTRITKAKSVFERVAELSQEEQLKIMHKILAGEEESLSREGILKEIINRETFREYMRSVIRGFRNSSIFGFAPRYRTDYIWITVAAPPGMWDQDLNEELFTAFAGYITGEVSRNITIRVIDSRDPWVISLFAVAGRGKIEDLENIVEMRSLYEKASSAEKALSRSFLVEHELELEKLYENLSK
ncbi:MAG: hypothetical protein DRJ33_01990 [Candidatus Methanomethylicota archaeon]|uniref:Uncharacterized protein n=1 Tax=Thermoproteota archaeon TaxID=2056631 RepID=A0A497F1B5_9CREN|nr:MAG: hypothetical protein DRJ33_01990 [Candidatus Verstraetearchaeota archaeon]